MSDTTKSVDELTFIDLVQYVQGKTGLGYAKSAKIVDNAIAPHITQAKKDLLEYLVSQGERGGTEVYQRTIGIATLEEYKKFAAIKEIEEGL